MPLEPKHVINFLEDSTNDKFNSELLDLLIKRINRLCFEECQIDRIQCTLTPLCTRRFLLKMRIKNGLTLDDLPKFCYSVQKNIVLRDFRGKTVVYKPFDAYLYLVDFLDIFFHGDYRKLNKFISFKNWDDALKIFEERIKNGENFRYYLKHNYMIFKFDDRIHIISIDENYVLCSANRENIATLELLAAICEFYNKLYFPEVKVKLVPNKFVEITTILPKDIVKSISEAPVMEENPSKKDHYFWNVFYEDLETMMVLCEEIHLKMDWNNNLLVKLCINLETNNINENGKRNPLRFRDLRLMLNFIQRLYNEFYVIWL
ncbi:MAG: hypothetical protein ACFFAO_17025 [Candidatus Hermodarchaeota archaeon]